MGSAPYRESTAAGARPLRVVLQEYRWVTNTKVLWAAVPFLIVILWEIWSIFSTKSGTVHGDSSFSMIATFGLMAMSVLYIAHRAYGNRSDGVQVFDDGVRMQREGTALEMRWDDVATLTSKVWRDGTAGAPMHRHVLTSARGESMTFTHELQGVDALAAELEERVRRKELPRALIAMRAGNAVQFGEVSVDAKGVSYAGQRASFADVGRAAIVDGVLTVYIEEGTSPLVALPASRVPNACVLVSLVEGERARARRAS
jgi:hypothetical protein